ncbi:MAG TPA: hypothetical protein VIO58_02420 [Candidatus Methanoperedens sp.]
MKNVMLVCKNAIKMNEDILKTATRCEKRLSCLLGTDVCRVESCIDDKIHFIKCMNSESCNYRIAFGYSYVCTCPVRKELFNRYKI